MLVARTQRKKGQRHYHGHTVGDKVWLEGTNLKLTHPKAKLDAKRYGPFTITEEISPVVYRVELPQQWKIHNVFHASLLTPYKETEEHGTNYAQPPPELVEGEEEYKVEQVPNSRRTGRAKKLQYLLQWKGYSRAHDSWQDATEVHAPELVADYLARKPSAVRTTTLKGHEGAQGNPIFMNSPLLTERTMKSSYSPLNDATPRRRFAIMHGWRRSSNPPLLRQQPVRPHLCLGRSRRSVWWHTRLRKGVMLRFPGYALVGPTAPDKERRRRHKARPIRPHDRNNMTKARSRPG
jgi:Chromo (CHRromatin Organisation MOdifier) domain